MKEREHPKPVSLVPQRELRPREAPDIWCPGIWVFEGQKSSNLCPKIWVFEDILANLCPKFWVFEGRFLPSRDKLNRVVAHYLFNKHEAIAYNHCCGGTILKGSQNGRHVV
jgi:hypothetical protein